MGMVVVLATSYPYIALLAYILDEFWPVQNFSHFFKKENSCLSRGFLINQMLYLFIHFKSHTKKDIFPIALIQNKDFKFPREKKQEKSAENQFMVGRYIIGQISGWVKFTVCVQHPFFRQQCNMACEHAHGLTETPKYHAGHAEDPQEILHCWGVTLLKGIALSAPTPGLASLNIKSNHSRGVSLQMGEATLPPSILPPPWLLFAPLRLPGLY